MTAQVQEGLRFRDQFCGMAANPLEALFASGHPRPAFVSPHTANWRGYVGGWEVRADRLQLATLTGWAADDERYATESFTLADLFPDPPPGGVFAEWVTDWLRVPRGEVVRYVHMGYSSEYERDWHLAVHRGRVVAVWDELNVDPGTITRELTPLLDEAFPEDAPFLRAVHVNWADRLPRLVYADWLDEREDPRGQLLRIDDALLDADADAKARLHTERAKVLAEVKDWFWMRLVGCELPKDRHGWEMREW